MAEIAVGRLGILMDGSVPGIPMVPLIPATAAMRGASFEPRNMDIMAPFECPMMNSRFLSMLNSFSTLSKMLEMKSVSEGVPASLKNPAFQPRNPSGKPFGTTAMKPSLSTFSPRRSTPSMAFMSEVKPWRTTTTGVGFFGS